jgi:hypothetical protein
LRQCGFALARIEGMSSLNPEPMPNPVDFVVVVSSDDDYLNGYHLFTEKVNRRLRSGYQLHGQPFNVEKIVCQAMIKPAESKSANGDVFTESTTDTTAFYKQPAIVK